VDWNWKKIKDILHIVFSGYKIPESLPKAENKKHEEEFIVLDSSECTHEEDRSGSSDCESVPECTPDTCNGECQGMGWCDLATEFRNTIVPPIKNKSHSLGCDCKTCNATLNL
jgi:hypothetical protein